MNNHGTDGKCLGFHQMFKAPSLDPGGSRCCSSLELLYLPMPLSEDMGIASTCGYFEKKKSVLANMSDQWSVFQGTPTMSWHRAGRHRLLRGT